MEKTQVFTHRLDLALRLVDTTSGWNIRGIGTSVFIDGEKIRFEEKPDNILIFRNIEKRKFQMEVISPGFETAQVDVDLDVLEKTLPLIELHMIPGENFPGGLKLHTLKGRLPGIRSLSAVRLSDNSVLIREFDTRKRIATVFNPHRLALDRVRYAIVDPDQNIYEPFLIKKMIDDQKIMTDRAPEMELKNYFRITPLISGMVSDNGDYCLRVRDDSETAKWLVRWEVNGEQSFRIVDFFAECAPQLEKGGA